jgi:hypothetical protein
MSQQHSYMVITTNFALEPLLDQYLATYLVVNHRES